MQLAKRPIMLVGSFQSGSAEDVLRFTGQELGDKVLGLTDGETGIRQFWVIGVYAFAISKHPDLEIIYKPKGVPGLPDYVSNGYGDLGKVTVKPGVTSLRFPSLIYAEPAAQSYAIFKRLRAEGAIAPGTKFQVCLPFPEDVARLFTTNARDMDIISEGYTEAMAREVETIARLIPAEDLLIQWDCNWVVLAADHDDLVEGVPPLDWCPHGDPMSRYRRYLRDLTPVVPANVAMGLHLCYGDLHHKHFFDPKSLALCVEMANVAVAESRHPITYVHMPVPRTRDDDAYFAATRDLDLKGGTLYAGLVHYSDGAKGGLKRLDTLARHYNGIAGIATECGLGRRPPDQDMKVMMKIHRDIAASFGKTAVSA